MKKLFVVLSFITLNFQLKAQDKLNLSEVIKEVKNQKSLYYFAEIPAEKNIKDRLSGTIEITDSANFNLLQLPVKISSRQLSLLLCQKFGCPSSNQVI